MGSQNRFFASAAMPLAAGFVKMTFSKLIRFHKYKLDEMLCKLDSFKNARSFRARANPPLQD